MSESIEEKKTTEIPVALLDKVTDYMEKSKALNDRVKSLEDGQISKEQYVGETEELVKGMLADHEKAFNHAEERRIKFAGATVTGDRMVTTLKSAMDTNKPQEKRLELFDRAMSTSSVENEVKALQDLNDDCLIADRLMKCSTHRERYLARGGMKTLDVYRRYQRQFENVVKAIAPMDTTDIANFVPTGLSAQVLDLPWLLGNIEALFDHVPMLTGPSYTVPIDLTPVSTIGDNIAEATTEDNPSDWDILGQNITDGLLTFTASKIRARMITSAELDEDAIMAWLPYIRKRLVDILRNSVEALDLNGDTTATHMDTDYEAAGTHTNWKGLRKLLLAGSCTKDCSSGNLSEANLLAMRAFCGTYGVDPEEGVWIFGPISYLSQIIKLANVATLDKIGDRATVIKGQLSAYYGSPVLVSAHQREDLNASGVDDGVTATKGACMYVNKKYFFHGDRRLVSLDAEKWITTDQYNLVAFRRMDFQPLVAPSTTYTFGCIGYNYTPAP